jgi:hypothetical protein
MVHVLVIALLSMLRALFLLVLCAAPSRAHGEETPVGSVEILAQPIDGFYGKRLLDGRIPILAHASVSDEGLLAARERLERLLAGAPKLRANLESSGYELHVSGLRQYTSELPEFRAYRGSRLEGLHQGQLFDWHMIGGHFSGSTSSCTEGTLLPIVGHRLYGYDVCLHELGHAIEWIALDDASRARIATAFKKSIGSGHWQDKYAASNEHEWFAEITMFYFRSPLAAEFYELELSRGRDWLCGYDPDACALVRDLYGGKTDPGNITMVELRPRPGDEEATLRSQRTGRPTRMVIRNRINAPVRVIWIDFDGARDKRKTFDEQPLLVPGAERSILTFATHAWVVTDARGHALCTFVSPESNSRISITGACD